MSKTSDIEPKLEHQLPTRPLPQKTKLEKTQSLLTVISTSIGLIGIAGSTFAFGLSTFYTGSVEVRPDFETPGLVVKVYTSEGHESVFHTRHINLMPGQYHLEISSPNGRVVHRDTKIRFRHNNDIDVKLGPPPEDSTISSSSTAGNNGVTNGAPHGGVLQTILQFGNEQDPANQPTEYVNGVPSQVPTQDLTKVTNPSEQHQAGISENNSASANSPSDQVNENARSASGAKKRWWQKILKREKSSTDSTDSSAN